MSIVRILPGIPYVNNDELPADTDQHLVQLTSRQLHIIRSFVYPYARFPHKCVSHLGGYIYEDVVGDDLSAYVDDVDEIEDAIGGIPMALTWADADDLENVAAAEGAGDSDTVPRGDHVHGIDLDAAVVTGLSDDELESILSAGEVGDVLFSRVPNCFMQAHFTGSIASGGTVVTVFTATHASGLLLVGCSVSYIAGAFMCVRGACTALGTLGASISNAKDTASKVNIYLDADNYVKAQNNYSTAVYLRLLFVAATSGAKIDTTI